MPDIILIDHAMVNDANAIPAMLLDPGKGLKPLLGRHEFGVFKEAMGLAVRKDNRGSDYWAGQAATPYLVYAANKLIILPIRLFKIILIETSAYPIDGSKGVNSDLFHLTSLKLCVLLELSALFNHFKYFNVY